MIAHDPAHVTSTLSPSPHKDTTVSAYAACTLGARPHTAAVPSQLTQRQFSCEKFLIRKYDARYETDKGNRKPK